MTEYYCRADALRLIREARQITTFQVGARFMTRRQVKAGIEAGNIAAKRVAFAAYHFVPVEILTCVHCGATGSEEADGFMVGGEFVDGPNCTPCHLKVLGEMERVT